MLLHFLVSFNGGVCSYSISLPNAKPDRIQTNRKQGFRMKRLRTITLLSPFNEKCFCLKTFFMFRLSVKNSAFCYMASVSSGFFFFLEYGSKCPVNEAKIRLLYGYMACDLRLFAHSAYSYSEKKYIKELWSGFRSKPERYLMLFDRIFHLCMPTLMTLSCIFHFVPILLTIRPLPLLQWNTA